MPLQILLLGTLNVCGCSTNEAKKRQIGVMFVKRNQDVLRLNDTKVKCMGESEFGVVSALGV